jgi:hypothetical protein
MFYDSGKGSQAQRDPNRSRKCRFIMPNWRFMMTLRSGLTLYESATS